MNYCSIEDAWGRGNCMSKQIREYMTDNKFTESSKEKEQEHNHEQEQYDKPVPIPDIKYQVQSQIINNKESHHIELDNCTDIVIHIKKCPKCYQKLRAHFRPQFKSQVLEKFQDIIDENRDIIVLVLVGVFIMMFFNLVNNISNSKN